jgi:hypothetical protein
MWDYFLQNEKYTSDGNIIIENSRKKNLPIPEKYEHFLYKQLF